MDETIKNLSTTKRGYTTRASHLIKLGQEDNQAWDEFYQKYRAMIYGIGIARNLSPNECEDLLQEVALICCKKLQTFVYNPDKCRFRSFLYKIAENVAFNLGRKQKKNATIQISEDYKSIPELDIKFMQEYEQFLLERSFLILKNSISSESYLAFDMLFRQELPIKEVVAQTGMSAGALYTLKHRCLKKLHLIISEMISEMETPRETEQEVE